MAKVTVAGFDYHTEQLTIETEVGACEAYEKRERAESAVAKIREKYGYSMLQRGVIIEDEHLKGLDIRDKK